jgi:hypothetical protein
MVGIDISGVQQGVPAGNWEFVVTKLSEGTHLPNPQSASQFAAAKAYPRRGFYHYATPAHATGYDEANYFADNALRLGFQPGKDIWQLDAETGLNESVTGLQWNQYIAAFLKRASARLGEGGYLYAGWPFIVNNRIDRTSYSHYKWWLPDYWHNDGAQHPPAAGVPTELVVIHQYTSKPFDKNAILNRERYESGFEPVPPPPPKVPPQFNPPKQYRFVSQLRIDPPKLQWGSWGLQPDWGVITFAGPFGGTMHGNPAIIGRTPSRIIPKGLIVPGAAPPLTSYPADAIYECLATSGERYLCRP